MSILASIGVLSALTLVNAPTAAALEELQITFTGEAVVGGLCSPVALTDNGQPTPPKECQLLVTDVAFASTTCMGKRASAKGKGIAVGPCAVAGGGTVAGWCGLSKGSITGTITVAGKAYGFALSWPGNIGEKAAGGILVMEGSITNNTTGATGPLTAKVLVTPDNDPATGSCADLTNKETKFIFSGSASGNPNLT